MGRFVVISYYNGKSGELDIINDIRYNVILDQLLDTVGNVNPSLSNSGHWIYDYN